MKVSETAAEAAVTEAAEATEMMCHKQLDLEAELQQMRLRLVVLQAIYSVDSGRTELKKRILVWRARSGMLRDGLACSKADVDMHARNVLEETVLEMEALSQGYMTEMDARCTALEEQNREAERRVDDAERRAGGLQRENGVLQGKAATLEVKNATLEDRVGSLDRQARAVEEQYATLEGRNATMERQAKVLQGQNDTLEQRSTAIAQRASELEEELQKTHLSLAAVQRQSEKSERATEKLFGMERELAMAQEDIQRQQTAHQWDREALEERERHVAKLDARIQTLEASQADAEEALHLERIRLRRSTEGLGRATGEADSATARLQDLDPNPNPNPNLDRVRVQKTYLTLTLSLIGYRTWRPIQRRPAGRTRP